MDLYTIQRAFLMGLYEGGGGLIYGGDYKRGNNKISNFNLAISNFIVM